METVVAVLGSRIEAELVAGMLNSNGVPARVSADDAGGVDLALQAQGVRVLVFGDDSARARELLAETAARAPEAKPQNAFQRWITRLLCGSDVP